MEGPSNEEDCMFVVAFGAVAQDKTERRVFMVSGTGWESCRDWQKSTDSFKFGCVMGRWEANAQMAQLLSDIPAARAVKDAFEPSGSLVWGDYIKAVDKLYGDPYNAAITLPNAVGFTSSALHGRAPIDDNALGHLRCLGAAGDDVTRIQECYKR